MTHATDIVAYTYQAEILCRDDMLDAANAWLTKDGVKVPYLIVEDALNAWAVSAKVDRDDEHTYDSDEFPKVVFASQVEDDETCTHCGEPI
jgi:hypothetical protein